MTRALNVSYDPFFNNIDWKENGDCIANNTHLKVIRITYYGSPADDGLQYILGEIGHNLPTRQQLQYFFSCMHQNTSIKRLIISQIEIDEFGSRLIEGLSGHCLEELHISHLTLGGIVCKAIGNALTHPKSKLKVLGLPSCNFDDNSFRILCNEFLGSSTLKSFNLMHNKRITSVGWQSLSTVLKHPNCKLAKLCLSSTYFNDEEADILGSALRGSSVKDLDISTNYSITNSGWQALINHLSQTSIEYLNIEVNEINDDGLAELLANIGMFKSLNLSSNNSITPAGWRSFFNTLRTRETQLMKLYISYTLIGSEDIQAVIGGLFSIRSTLRTLQMKGMDSTFTSQRWRTLFTTLQDSNLNLVKLDLGSNNIDDEGMRLLTSVVTSMASLRYLRLEDNKQVTPVGWQALASYLLSPTCVLKELDLNENNIDDNLLVAFSGALIHNKTLEHLSFDECWDPNEDDPYVIAERGYKAVSALVCNKTSIMDTYNSNHTLNYVFYIRDNVTSSYLELNENKDKTEVARQKILQTHFSATEDYNSDTEDSDDSDTEDSDEEDSTNTTSNTQEFLDMELEVMPTAISWVGRPLSMGWRGTNVSGLSLLYNLMKRVPDLFDSRFTTLQDSNLNLVKLDLGSNNIDDEGMRLLTSVVTSMASLRYLRLEDNKQVTPVGWQALASYLLSPTCVLKELDLNENNIDDNLLVAFSGALIHNKTLEHLSFDECWDPNEDDPYVIAERGYKAVSALVCNKTSIMDTYNSNHTLNYVFYIRDNVTSSYLELNENKDKTEVARQKILQTHFSATEDYNSDTEDSDDSDTEDSDEEDSTNTTSNTQEFLDMELEVMPTAISWVGRPLSMGWRGTNVSGLSLLYNLMKRVPDLFDSSAQKKPSAAKRKRGSP